MRVVHLNYRSILYCDPKALYHDIQMEKDTLRGIFMRKFGKMLLLTTLMGVIGGDFLVENLHNNHENSHVSVIAKSPSSNDRTSNQREFQRLIDAFSDRSPSTLPNSQVLQSVATKFLGAAYREGLLDKGKAENLFVSLTEFDCVLFVETVLAFSRNLISANPNYENFVQKVEEVRYVNGKLNGYCSRLHYFSEWIRDNQRRNIVRDLTGELGGVNLDKTLNFMSSNWEKYPRLKNSEANYQCILAMERKMAIEMTAEPLRYIPTKKIDSIYPLLNAGDIIAVTTNLKGLDATHTGLVYLTPKGVGFIHASPSGQVTVANDLQRYIENVDQAIGIMVARPVLAIAPNVGKL